MSMVGYDAWHCGSDDDLLAWINEQILATRDRKKAQSASKLRDALTDIAYDSGSLEAAQKRAREALKES